MKQYSYVWHLLVSLGTRLVMIALRLVRNILLARLLGPADRGLFALLSTLPDLIAALTSGGLNTAVGYQAAKQKPMGLLITQVLIYGCLLSGLLTLLCIVLLNWLGTHVSAVEQLGVWIWLLIPVVPLTVLKSGLLTLHNADERVNAFNMLRLLESSTPLFLFLVFIFFWRDRVFDAALISWIGGLVVVTIAGWCWLKRFHVLKLKWQPKDQGELLRYSARSHPDILFQQILLRADYLFIGALLPASALGHYAMASAAAELLLIIPEAVTTPLMKRLLQQDKKTEQLTPLALRVTATVMLCACLAMALIGEWLIVTLFGIDYAPAYPALVALLPGLFALCYASILRLDLLGKGLPGTLSLIVGSGAALNLILNFILIPKFNITGAAIASSVAYIFVTLIMLALYCKITRVPFYHTLLVTPTDISAALKMLKGKKIDKN